MLASAIMGVPVYRDIEHGTQNYLFSYPISEKGYILGRFAGSMATLFLVSLGLILGFSQPSAMRVLIYGIIYNLP